MSRFHAIRGRALRSGLGAAILATALGGALAAPATAAPVSLTLDYTCNFPLLDPQPLKLTITSDIPTSVALGASTNAFQINASAAVSAQATFGLGAVEAKSIEGKADAASNLQLPGGIDLPLNVPTQIAKTNLPASGAFTTNATGSTPALNFPTAGTAKITVGDLVLTLTPRLADGTLTALDTFEVECFQAPGQNTTLATIQVGGTGPDPDPDPTVIPYSYDLKGSTVLRNLTRGTLPISGSLDAKLTLETQKFEADLKLNATRGTLRAFNFLPVTAVVSFTNAAKTTGSVGAGGAVTSNSKLNIRLSSVNVFGIPLVAGNCRTQKPSDINLKSTPGFDILVGGTLTGSYAISNLIDCGPLTILVSPLTAGSGNTITANLTKKAS